MAVRLTSSGVIPVSRHCLKRVTIVGKAAGKALFLYAREIGFLQNKISNKSLFFIVLTVLRLLELG